jgi:1,4-alpha-glucan branching enzyme
MYGQPGKKLLFMGAELGQWHEWRHDQALDWALADFPAHEGLSRLLADLNRLYREVPALHERDTDGRGFEWVEANDDEQSVLVFARHGSSPDKRVVVALNFTPVPRYDYRVGVEHGGRWRELLNTDAEVYGGSGVGNLGGVDADVWPWDGRPHSLALTLPPLGAVFLAPEG